MEIPIQEMLTQVKSVCKAHIEDARESILAIIKETFSAAILATKVEDKSCNEFGLFMVKIGMSNFDFATSKQSAQPQPYLENVFVVDGQRIPNYGNLLAATISVLSASGQGNTDAGDVDGWVRL
ncbi:hypothetical protein EV182_001626 [Spiromyces aspiralis]|uniref:Uncharacterized protein n=1 Tax=Spiromyces aspiralis TaxID=68401 RepID=A0ACC1HGW3_9FUNG|nr:hypothetical protein EV182_001626 [Spiromyces aspiralis]